MTLFKHLQAEKGTSRIMISAFFFLGRITYKPERMINVLRSKQASGLSSFRKQKGESPSLCMINSCLFVCLFWFWFWFWFWLWLWWSEGEGRGVFVCLCDEQCTILEAQPSP